MFPYDLNAYLKDSQDYLELRVQDNRVQRIQLTNGNVSHNSFGSKKGVSARAYKNGAWGFASSSVVDSSSISQIIKEAKFNANYLDHKLHKSDHGFKPTATQASDKWSAQHEKLTVKDKIDFLKNVDAYLIKTYPDLKARDTILHSLDIEKNLVTSEGSSSYSMLPRATVYVSLTIEKHNEPYQIFIPYYGFGASKNRAAELVDLQRLIDENYLHLVKKSEGVYPQAGYKECILDSKIAGILVHEAIGHTTEADLVQSGSIAGQYLNKKIASELISVVDFAHSTAEGTCMVPVYIDDEGTEAQDTVIIEKGILKSFMHNKESAQSFGVEPTGHARAFEYSDEPLIRMRNTAILAGESRLKQMISSIEDGYYLIQSSNGQADSTSEFMFGVVLGYEIKNGKIANGLKDITISGVATDVLQSVSMVSDDMEWMVGFCGKKQLMTVSMGGPAIKCKINVGGR